MKKLLFLSILLCFSAMGFAQRVYFIYLQSDNGTPFYVRMGDKIHSSSSIGYLVLPNLKDSTYILRVGMAGQNKSEQMFNVALNSTDRGFLLKNFDQGLNLFDLNTLEIVAPQPADINKDHTYITRTDNFTKTLSQAANDPSLLTETIVKKESAKEKPVTKPKQAVEAKAEPIAQKEITPASSQADSISSSQTIAVTEAEKTIETAIVVDSVKQADTLLTVAPIANDIKNENETTQDTVVAQLTQDSIQTVKPAVATAEQQSINAEVIEYKKSTIIRRSESSTSEGFGLTFVDIQDHASDTIRLLIPNPKVQLRASSDETIANDDIKPIIQQPSVSQPSSAENNLVKQKPACSNVASENDFKKLRREMAAQNTDNDMLEKAKKVFKSKCFTTEQIKHLSTLFLSAAGKYQFFDAAYSSVTDQEIFASLQSELNDEYYSNRFKALIGK